MRWRRLALAALLAVGCETVSSGPREHVIAGTPSRLAVTLRGAILDHDGQAELDERGGRVKLVCRSPSGQSFEIALARTSDGRTRIRATCAEPPDEETKTLLKDLDLR